MIIASWTGARGPPMLEMVVFPSTASIFGSQEKAVLERAVTMDSFLETNQLPDWMSCDPAQREELHTSIPIKKSSVSPATTRRTQERSPASAASPLKELLALKTRS